jgi:hypothetical protein
MVAAQNTMTIDRLTKIFTGLGAKNITLSSIPDITFFMDETIEGYIAKCAVKCETQKAWIGRDSIFQFYKAMQSYMPYSGMKRGYYIASGSFMKDAIEKAGEINKDREDFEIILINTSDLAQYESPQAVTPEVKVEKPKKVKKPQVTRTLPVPQTTQVASQVPQVQSAQENEAAEVVVERPLTRLDMFKQLISPKGLKKPMWLTHKPKTKYQSEEDEVKKPSFILDFFRAIGYDVFNMLADFSFIYIMAFAGLFIVLIIAGLLMVFHSSDASFTYQGTTIFP